MYLNNYSDKNVDLNELEQLNEDKNKDLYQSILNPWDFPKSIGGY